MSEMLAGHRPDLWTLDPAIHYLNHGSFGACPRAVLEHQAALRAELEREPVAFLVRRLPGRLAEVREAVGRFMGADPDGIVFVPNATTGVNAALRSWELSAGDEILTTRHAYAACRRAMDEVAKERGAKVVAVEIPFPLAGEEAVVETVLAAATPRTKVAVLDHVTSPTALVLPIERLVAALRQRGVETIVDGAHALGMVPLDLTRLGAACWTGNAHKWLCAPKGAAVLHVREEWRARVRPLVVSHGYEGEGRPEGFRPAWDWLGTVDPTPWLSIPACIRHLGEALPGGWPALMERNRRLALTARGILLEAFGVEAPCPESMIGSIAAVPLPAAAPGSPVARLDQDALATWCFERAIESWFFPWPAPGGKLVRVSAQLYNDERQYRALAALLAEALRAG